MPLQGRHAPPAAVRNRPRQAEVRLPRCADQPPPLRRRNRRCNKPSPRRESADRETPGRNADQPRHLGDLGTGQHDRHTFKRLGLRFLDMSNPRMRIWTSQHGDMEHSRHLDVAHMQRPPGYFWVGVRPINRLPDHRVIRHHVLVRLVRFLIPCFVWFGKNWRKRAALRR